MKMNEYVDVLIPRGGAGLIRAVVNRATIPVIETGTGNCHIYVDESADFDMAIRIILNAKTQRIGVCNACESLVIHEKIVDAFMPKLAAALQQKDVVIHADEKSLAAAERREHGKWWRTEKGTVVGGDGVRLGQGVSRLYDLREDGVVSRRGDRTHQPLQYRAFGGNHHRKLHERAAVPG